jgi:membrane associated rhomboid family serine protease
MSLPRIPPVTLALLVANLAVYAVQYLTGSMLETPFALWPLNTDGVALVPSFHVWQLLTYGFLHAGPAHLFFNMFALYMFGGEIERLLGPRRFLVYYLVCVVGAAVTQLFVMDRLGGPPAATVGASGGVFGLLLAFGLAYPQRRIILLFPPIPMPAWLFVTLYGLLELYLGVTGTSQGVAHFAHLGGMVAGALLLVLWRAQARPG